MTQNNHPSDLLSSETSTFPVEVLGPGVTYTHKLIGKMIVDVFTILDVKRETINFGMTKADDCLAKHPQDTPYFVLFDQGSVKSASLMSPYMKNRVEKTYGAAQCKIYAAVIINPGFLTSDSKAFLANQSAVQSGRVSTQFFTKIDAGYEWLKSMIKTENMLD
jgi:hypothetical protein